MIRPTASLLLCGSVLFLAAACASSPTVAERGPEDEALEKEVVITLHQDVQLLDETRTIVVRGDGAVRVEYRRKVDGSITRADALATDPATVVALVNGLFDLGILDMPDRYPDTKEQVQRTSDGRYQPLIIVTADGSCHTLTIRMGTWEKNVSACNSAPGPLTTAYQRVAALARVTIEP